MYALQGMERFVEEKQNVLLVKEIVFSHQKVYADTGFKAELAHRHDSHLVNFA